MDKNPALLARTEVDVTHKLLAAGVSKHDLPHLTFRQKVVRLINTAQPRPKHNFVTVWVTPPSCLGGARELVEVQLPLEAEIGQVYQLLREVVEARMAFRRERKKRAVKGADDDDDDDDGGCGGWKYQLLSPDLKRVLIRKSVCMETDGDYRGLVRRIGKEGGRAPVAVLMQVGKSPCWVVDLEGCCCIGTLTTQWSRSH